MSDEGKAGPDPELVGMLERAGIEGPLARRLAEQVDATAPIRGQCGYCGRSVEVQGPSKERFNALVKAVEYQLGKPKERKEQVVDITVRTVHELEQLSDAELAAIATGPSELPPAA